MAPVKRIGPVTAIVAPGRPQEGDKPGVSPTYRNIEAVDGLPTTVSVFLLLSAFFAGLPRQTPPLNDLRRRSVQLMHHATLYESFNAAVEAYPDRPCLGWRPVDAAGVAGPYQFHTYKETQALAADVASALSQSGVREGGKVGIFSANRVEWMLTVRGVDVLSAAAVPIYDTLGESAVEYVIKHSGEPNLSYL